MLIYVDVRVDGLFRVSGSKRRTDGLKALLSEPPVEQLLYMSAVELEFNPHDVASVVKHYFAELPDSILQSKHFIAYEQIEGNRICSFHTAINCPTVFVVIAKGNPFYVQRSALG